MNGPSIAFLSVAGATGVGTLGAFALPRRRPMGLAQAGFEGTSLAATLILVPGVLSALAAAADLPGPVELLVGGLAALAWVAAILPLLCDRLVAAETAVRAQPRLSKWFKRLAIALAAGAFVAGQVAFYLVGLAWALMLVLAATSVFHVGQSVYFAIDARGRMRSGRLAWKTRWIWGYHSVNMWSAAAGGVTTTGLIVSGIAAGILWPNGSNPLQGSGGEVAFWAALAAACVGLVAQVKLQRRRRGLSRGLRKRAQQGRL